MWTSPPSDDDVLSAAKGLAARQRKSLGEVISELSRNSLTRDASPPPRERNGVPLLAQKAGSAPVTLELINQLRDDTAGSRPQVMSPGPPAH